MCEFLLLAALSMDIKEAKSLFMGTYADLGLGFPSLLIYKIKYLEKMQKSNKIYASQIHKSFDIIKINKG